MSDITIPPPKPPAPRPPWGWLGEALKLAPSEGALVEAGLAGDVVARIVHPARPAMPMPVEYWAGTLDADRSRIRPAARLEFGENGVRETWIGWHTVHVDLDSVRKCFGLEQQLAEEKLPRHKGGGPPPKWDWEEAVVGVFALVYHGAAREPERLADVENLLREWFLNTKDDAPSESMIREHARKLFRGFHEADN